MEDVLLLAKPTLEQQAALQVVKQSGKLIVRMGLPV